MKHCRDCVELLLQCPALQPLRLSSHAGGKEKEIPRVHPDASDRVFPNFLHPISEV